MDDKKATRRNINNIEENPVKRNTGNTGSDKITFHINLIRLWQIIATAACALAAIFCSLWINSTSDTSNRSNDTANQTSSFVTKIQNINIPQKIDSEIIFDPDFDVSGVSITGKKIIIDPGHGGDVPGGTTGVSGKLEKDVNLEISLKLKNLLENEGATVIMTRDTDTALGDTWEADMQARENIILENNADMFLSIHQNEFENEVATGPQVFFVQQGSVGKRLAVCIQDMLNYELDIENPRIALEAAYRVLKPGSQPSCTIECGFMSNPEEDLKLQDPTYQNKIVQAITDGIKLYVKQFG